MLTTLMQGFYFAMAAEQTAVGWEFPSLQSQSHLSVVSSQLQRDNN